MAQELFRTFEKAEEAWFKIKNRSAEFFDEGEEDDLNRYTDQKFFEIYGFDLVDF